MLVCRQMFLIGRVSGLIAWCPQPRGAPSVRVVSTAPASDRRGRRESVCTGMWGLGKGWPSIGAAGGGWCAIKYGETEADGCLIGIKSDTPI